MDFMECNWIRRVIFARLDRGSERKYRPRRFPLNHITEKKGYRDEAIQSDRIDEVDIPRIESNGSIKAAS